MVLELRREKLDLDPILLKREESWHGLLADIKETFVLDLDDVDWEEVGAKDLEVTGRNEAWTKHLVDLLEKLNKL